jgi:hypothetical protein
MVDRARRKRQRVWTKHGRIWCEAARVSENILIRFWNQEFIRAEHFQNICHALDVDWEQVVEPGLSLYCDPNFVGRMDSMRQITKLISLESRVILIQGEAGIGKTVLALKYLQTQKLDRELRLFMGSDVNNVPSVTLGLEDWLRYDLGEAVSQDFGINLNRLWRRLREDGENIGILIDSLDPALKNGKFIESHRRYVDLLRILGQVDVKSTTFLTSRMALEEADLVPHLYTLEGMQLDAWHHWFANYNIEIDKLVLQELHEICQGKPAIMNLITQTIPPNFSGDILDYWQENYRTIILNPILYQVIQNLFSRFEQLLPELETGHSQTGHSQTEYF